MFPQCSHRGCRSRGRGRAGTAQGWISWSHHSLLSTSAAAGTARSSVGVARCEALQMFCVVEPRWSDTNLPVMLPLLHPWSEQGGWYCGNCAGQNWSVLTGNGQMSGDWVEKYVNILNELVLWCWRSRMQPVGLRSENCYLVSSFVSSWYSEPIHLLKVAGKCFGCGHEKWMRWKGTRETKAFSSFYRE